MTIGNKETLGKNIKKFLDLSGKDRKDMAKALGVPYSTVTDWINAKKYPRIDNIEKLAEYFNVLKSDLIEDFEVKQKDNDSLAKIIVKLRMDKDLTNVVEKLLYLDKDQLEGLKKMLDSFI